MQWVERSNSTHKWLSLEADHRLLGVLRTMTLATLRRYRGRLELSFVRLNGERVDCGMGDDLARAKAAAETIVRMEGLT